MWPLQGPIAVAGAVLPTHPTMLGNELPMSVPLCRGGHPVAGAARGHQLRPDPAAHILITAAAAAAGRLVEPCASALSRAAAGPRKPVAGAGGQRGHARRLAPGSEGGPVGLVEPRGLGGRRGT